MALMETGCRKLELRTGNKLLSRVYHVGVNSQTAFPDIQTICISSLCDEVMGQIAEPNNKKKNRLPIVFAELCYIWSGILFIFKSQTALLYDETMRQANFTLAYVQRSQTVITMWQKSTTAPSSKKNRSRKNDDPINHLPKKRVKFSDVEFDWQSIVDSEPDDESTIQILKTSKIMNRDQISIREVISEPLPEIMSQYGGFEAAADGNTQTFLQIRELVAQGQSIAGTIQSERATSMIADDAYEAYEDDGYYAPMTPRQSSPHRQSPLPDIDRCYEELDEDIPDPNENVEMVIERRTSSWSHISLPSLPSKLSPPKRATKGKRRRRLCDKIIQIRLELDAEAEPNLMRCTDARSDCVTKDHIMRQIKLINFHKPAHAFRSLQPRSVTDTVPMMVAMQRVQRGKRKEPDDLNMVEDFLKSFGKERQEDERQERAQQEDVQQEDVQLEDVQMEDVQLEDVEQEDIQLEDIQPKDFLRDNQPLENRRNRPTKRKRSTSPTDMIDERPQPCSEKSPQASELDFGCQDDESLGALDVAEPMWEPEPFCDDPEPIVEPEQTYENVTEANLPMVNQSPIVERQETSDTVKNVPKTHNFRLESDIMPRSVLRLLNQFVTVNDATNELSQSRSQALLMLSNQKNREQWGLKNVLQILFRLWYSNVHPLGMVELLHPEKKKVAAALAFYSIMELNSSRVGLIVIEKVNTSNAIYNIAMSEKLISLLQKGRGK